MASCIFVILDDIATLMDDVDTLINIAANKNDIVIHSGKIPSVFDCFYHYGPSHGHRTKVNESIL